MAVRTVALCWEFPKTRDTSSGVLKIRVILYWGPFRGQRSGHPGDNSLLLDERPRTPFPETSKYSSETVVPQIYSVNNLQRTIRKSLLGSGKLYADCPVACREWGPSLAILPIHPKNYPERVKPFPCTMIS